ncbi:unnamed protein product [Effrenium voratum]|nr:unnamed protein product [Effrenium voratum]
MLCRVAILLAHAAATRTSSDLTLTTSCNFLDYFNVSKQVNEDSLKTAVKSKCNEIWGVRTLGLDVDYPTLTDKEGRWMQAKCREGVDIAQCLCAQETNTGPSIAPLEVIDHWEKGNTNVESGRWWEMKETAWCSQSPPPQWTGFQDCFHACQFRFRDCHQLGCGVCRVSPASCDGVADKLVYDRYGNQQHMNAPPARHYSFLDACVLGCQRYVNFKSGGGPACKVGIKLMQHRHKRPE